MAEPHARAQERMGGGEPIHLPPWAVVTATRVGHIARVVALVETWAAARAVGAVETDRWRRAALLHDALRDAEPGVLARYAPQGTWPAQLWHGPAAAGAARADGERDPGVLDALTYHSIGYASWDDAGRMLYLADWLEPGRSHERALLDTLAERVPHDPAGALREVAARRIGWVIHRHRPLARETWEFWNSLAAAGSSSPA